MVNATTCMCSVYLGCRLETRTRKLGYNLSMKKKMIVWLPVFAVVLTVGLVGFLIISGFRAVTGPVTELREDLGTQVSRLLNPTPTIIPNPVTIVREVRTLARLETIHYSVEKIIMAETRQGPFGFLFGDRLLLVAHGDVIAGVDLDKIEEDDLWIDDMGRVYIVLPEPEVFVAALDNEKTFIYDREKGFFTRGDVDLETAARKAAEAEILDAAMEDNILEQATVNAQNYLFAFIRALGFSDVIFAEASDSPPPTATPSATLQSTPAP